MEPVYLIYNGKYRENVDEASILEVVANNEELAKTRLQSYSEDSVLVKANITRTGGRIVVENPIIVQVPSQ